MNLVQRCVAVVFLLAMLAGFMGPSMADHVRELLEGPTPIEQLERIDGDLLSVSACEGRRDSVRKIGIKTERGERRLALPCADWLAELVEPSGSRRPAMVAGMKVTVRVEPARAFSSQSAKFRQFELEGHRVFPAPESRIESTPGLLRKLIGQLAVIFGGIGICLSDDGRRGSQLTRAGRIALASWCVMFLGVFLSIV